MIFLTEFDERVKTLEENSPPDTKYVVECILSRLTDDELGIMETVAKMYESGFAEDAIEKKMGPDQWQEYQKMLEHFKEIHKGLIARAEAGDCPGILIAGVERWW
jgi:hypothetical protein